MRTSTANMNTANRLERTRLGRILLIATIATLIGCGGGDSSSDDDTHINSVKVLAANADGTEVDLTANISYSLSDGTAYLKTASDKSPSTRDYDDTKLIASGSGNVDLIAHRSISTTDNTSATISAWMSDSLGQSKGDGFGFADAKVNLAFPNNTTRQTTQLTKIQLALIPNTYTVTYNELYKANEHKFRFKVLDQDGSSVSGLETQFNDYFSISENGGDASNETINQATEQSETLSCYFVIDASNSISKANSEIAVREAVSKMVISLAPVSKLFYRQFATDVKKLESVRDLKYDDTDRFTSLYAAIDETLTEISQNKDSSQKIMIVFTDGKDNYSQNDLDYRNITAPNPPTNEAVYSYLSNRIPAIIPSINGGLALYTIGLGSDIDIPKLTELATLGKGAFVNASDENALNDKFSEIYRLIKSTYALSYLSPNLGPVKELILKANINGTSASLNIVGTN